MDRRDKMVAVRITESDLELLDYIVGGLKSKNKNLKLSRGAFLRSFIYVGNYLMISERSAELLKLVELEV